MRESKARNARRVEHARPARIPSAFRVLACNASDGPPSAPYIVSVCKCGVKMKRQRSIHVSSDYVPLKRYKASAAVKAAVARKAYRINQSSKQIQRIGAYRIPFPKEHRVIMEWVGTQAYVNPGTTAAALALRPLDLYDPDSTTSFGTTRKANPFDQLLSSNGPYRNYIVERFEIQCDFVNASSYPVNIFMCNTTDAVGPGNLTLTNSYLQSVDRDFIRTMLTPSSGSRSFTTLKLAGSLANMVADPTDVTYAGAYNSSPTTHVYTHIYLDSSMTSNNVQVYCAPRIIFYVKLYSQDAPASA